MERENENASFYFYAESASIQEGEEVKSSMELLERREIIWNASFCFISSNSRRRRIESSREHWNSSFCLISSKIKEREGVKLLRKLNYSNGSKNIE